MFSGHSLVELSADEFTQITENSDSSVKSLKEHLSGIISQPRFRQKLLCKGIVLEDDAVVEIPTSLVLVVLTFCPADDNERRCLLDAVTEDQAWAVERLLQRPLDPEPLPKMPRAGLLWSVLDVVAFFLLRTLQKNQDVTLESGETALWHAAACNSLRCARHPL